MAIAEKIKEMVGVTPTYTTEERENVRSEAQRRAKADWLKLVLDHHVQLENIFAEVKAASTVDMRKTAQKKLAVILTGHANAEEAVIYPFMKINTSSMDAGHAYKEQAVAKMEMVALDSIQNKLSSEYDDKLEEIRAAVEHHMVEEERDYFPELQDSVDATVNAKISQHYQMEYERYVKN